jgi:hypothetical protein
MKCQMCVFAAATDCTGRRAAQIGSPTQCSGREHMHRFANPPLTCQPRLRRLNPRPGSVGSVRSWSGALYSWVEKGFRVSPWSWEFTHSVATAAATARSCQCPFSAHFPNPEDVFVRAEFRVPKVSPKTCRTSSVKRRPSMEMRHCTLWDDPLCLDAAKLMSTTDGERPQLTRSCHSRTAALGKRITGRRFATPASSSSAGTPCSGGRPRGSSVAGCP